MRDQRERLVLWRASEGMSQADAARRLGVAQAAWAAWETGRKEPDLGNALALERLTKGKVRAAAWPSARRVLDALAKRERAALSPARKRRQRAANDPNDPTRACVDREFRATGTDD